MDNSDEPEDLLDGKIVFQKNKDRTFSKTKVICTLCEKTLSFHRSNTRLTTATRSMCWLARGVQVECAKPDSLAGHIVQKKRRERTESKSNAELQENFHTVSDSVAPVIGEVTAKLNSV
ncbi:unnamed protein product [Pleuronectes platessa]|uniref:Uncharacterized protein n=1 Tax=Pleuronectes platessa TaxID=8262 RepID=A0A9N7Y971_PLEPL|nr:unnamed protein product [Pleuronectes platessa]